MAYGRHAAATVDIFGQMFVIGGIGTGKFSSFPLLPDGRIFRRKIFLGWENWVDVS
jgi:hypothetical protein